SLLTGVILAGGKGARFGGNKALTKINGQYLIEWIIESYKEIFNEIIISTNAPSLYRFKGIKTVKDIIPHKGPLVGIFSSLKESLNNQIFVSACDMPFIRPSLIRYMVMKSKGYDVVVPSLGEEMLEPLHALYKKSCLPAIERAIKANQVRVISFYSNVRVYEMGREEIIQQDPKLDSFFNINTKEDLNKARELFKPGRCISSHGCRS
ncbi:MAG: molybdenum cofactor guanylyltransferase, partial [Candidatus Hodarchaeota archaeon]